MQSRYSLGLGPGFGQTKRYITSSASQGPRHLRAVCDTTLALHHFRQLHTSNSGRLAAEYFKELLQFLTVSSNSMPGSKPRLESLQAALQKFNKQGGKEKNIMLSDSARADLCWWEKMLAGGMDIPVYTPNAHSVFVDASTGWGLAVVNGENAWVWKWRDLWRESDKYNANWAELVAIELGIRAASMCAEQDHPHQRHALHGYQRRRCSCSHTKARSSPAGAILGSVGPVRGEYCGLTVKREAHGYGRPSNISASSL
ncbi:hypothetical protein CYLTODRAFT_164216 [Cylindrobasidium torrendii FP15055 ss-10]|uniref:Uncharacterized protein n=1 Tax=Cylindrobasidium torrendii FP15055 ss-10 TaxID=1314674 RepID=A0A0D7AY26_9AGAR|nr:hypothetical protein CYLTODRAFT_164216 [Cylindrobasidium torrendii FP15055 ss-10]